MNFTHTEDRRMLSASLGRFIADRYDFDTRQKISQNPQGYSPNRWQAFADLGAIGALFAEHHGGLGGTGHDISVVFEALGRGLVLEPFLPTAVLAGSAIAHAGNDDQLSLLPAVTEGTLIMSLAHEEAQTHYQHEQVRTQAVREGAHWVLQGRKTMVALAHQSELLVVSARTAGQPGDAHGISLFIVPTDTPGVRVRPFPTADGGRAADVALHGVVLPPSALLGALGQGLATLEHAAGRGVMALCAEALGAMETIKAATVGYLQTRRQFGKPIGSFQALQHRMATVLLEIEQARSAVINAASALDEPDRITRERALSAAKYTIGRVGQMVAEESIQLHGGIGMTWELPLAHYAKRLVAIDHQLGDEDHHLARFIALGHA